MYLTARIYVYPSHDTATGSPENDNGDHFNMMDYHVLSMDSVGAPVTDNGVALHIKDILGPAANYGRQTLRMPMALTICIFL